MTRPEPDPSPPEQHSARSSEAGTDQPGSAAHAPADTATHDLPGGDIPRRAGPGTPEVRGDANPVPPVDTGGGGKPGAAVPDSGRPGRRWVPIAAVLVVVAGLAIWWLWPSGGAESAQRMTAGPYQVTLRVGDGSPRTGDNAVDLDITTGQGDPATPQRVSVDPAMPQMGHAVPPIAATAVTPGHYRATVNLPMPGQWEVAVQLAGPQGSGSATFSVQAN